MSDMAIDFERRAISVDEYHRMADAGILGADERVELLDGELIVMPPASPAHAFSVNAIVRLLTMRFLDRAYVRGQSPVSMPPRSEPEPDIALVTNEPARWRTEHPGPGDVYLAIEVALSSRALDLGKKLSINARAGIVDSWVLDLVERRLHVHREPRPDGGYAVRRTLESDASIAPLAFPNDEIAVADML